jgi:hypothetical protein
VSFQGEENDIKSTMGMSTQPYECAKTHRTFYFKWVNCVACESHLSKAVKK